VNESRDKNKIQLIHKSLPHNSKASSNCGLETSETNKNLENSSNLDINYNKNYELSDYFITERTSTSPTKMS
jgi:hypothetical protein